MEFAMCLGDYQKEAHCGLTDESANGGGDSAATSILILAFATLFLWNHYKFDKTEVDFKKLGLSFGLFLSLKEATHAFSICRIRAFDFGESIRVDDFGVFVVVVVEWCFTYRVIVVASQ